MKCLIWDTETHATSLLTVMVNCSFTMQTWSGILVHHGTVPHVSIMAYLAEKVAGEQHPRNGENIFRIQLARSSILDLGALPESSLEPMPSFQPIIVMHSSFAIGPLPPCIPFISNPMVPHILAKKENFSPIPTDLLLSLMSILDRTAVCIFA